ncbi:MAG: hypothetical protein K0S07_822 [Chlamydiales bacterium]|jgi:hypothetical protein|nr:hypothetical protein [Chlamydiales bacterium]
MNRIYLLFKLLLTDCFLGFFSLKEVFFLNLKVGIFKG